MPTRFGGLWCSGPRTGPATSLSTAGVQPGCSFTELYVRIWELLESGQEEAGERLHRQLLPYLSYWMQGVEIIVAAEKLISARRGLFVDPYCRSPRHRLDSTEVSMVDQFLHEFAELLPDVQQ